MAQETIYKYGIEEITVPYGQKIAISNYGGGTAIIYYQSQPGNVPPAYYESQRITNEGIVLGTFSADQNIKIDAQNSIVNYEVGTEFELGGGGGGNFLSNTYYSHGTVTTGTVTPDLNDGYIQYINCSGSITIANPTNIPDSPVEFKLIIDKNNFSDWITFGTDYEFIDKNTNRQIILKLLYVSGSIVKSWQEQKNDVAKLNPDAWSERTTALTASDAGADDRFGRSCALSDDGTVLAVGSYLWDGGAGANQGAVYIFDWTGSSWSERTTALTASDAGANHQFGISCALSDDGTVLAVGSYLWNGGAGVNQGAVYIFDWTGSSWSERTTALTASDAGADDQFGISCALSDDGTVLAVGAYLWDGGAGADQGSEYVFDLVDYLGSV